MPSQRLFSPSHRHADVCHADGVNSYLFCRVANEAMLAPDVLLDRIGEAPEPTRADKRLVVVMGQLSDFDSMEYIQLVTGWKSLQ